MVCQGVRGAKFLLNDVFHIIYRLSHLAGYQMENVVISDFLPLRQICNPESEILYICSLKTKKQ